MLPKPVVTPVPLVSPGAGVWNGALVAIKVLRCRSLRPSVGLSPHIMVGGGGPAGSATAARPGSQATSLSGAEPLGVPPAPAVGPAGGPAAAVAPAAAAAAEGGDAWCALQVLRHEQEAWVGAHLR